MMRPMRQRARPSPRTAAVVSLLAALLVLPLALAPRGEAFVYWSGGDAIGRANLDGSGVDRGFIAFEFPPDTWRIGDVAVTADHIYWTNHPGGKIGRANLDGTGVNPRFIRDLPGANGASRSTPSIFTGRAAPGPQTTARSVAPTSTAPASIEASSPAPADRTASRSPPAISTGRTTTVPPTRPRSAGPTSTAVASTPGSSPPARWTSRSTPHTWFGPASTPTWGASRRPPRLSGPRDLPASARRCVAGGVRACSPRAACAPNARQTTPAAGGSQRSPAVQRSRWLRRFRAPKRDCTLFESR